MVRAHRCPPMGRHLPGVTARVAWIHVAPVKALQIHTRERVTLTLRGVEDDRRFCLVDEAGRMLNAKRVAAFVAVRPEIEGDRLTLRMPDGRAVSSEIVLGRPLTVSIYGRHVPAHEVDGPFTGALSEIGRGVVRLVRFDEPGEGPDRKDWNGVTGYTGAASLLSSASLDELARAAGASGPVDPRRFRMLFGVTGVPAHAEDGWIGRPVRLGEAVIVPLGNIGRCAVTSLHPESAASDLDTLAALARYRGAVEATERLPFGVHARVERAGVVSVGDEVVV